MDNITLIMITLFFISSGLIIMVLNLIQGRKKKKIKKTLENLGITTPNRNKSYPSNIINRLQTIRISQWNLPNLALSM